jgi:hypothetical protein
VSALLRPGDVISYSAGSTRTSPDGFRVLRRRGDPLSFVAQTWPEVAAALGPAAPLVVSAYPASLGSLPQAIFVDSYLSVRTSLRALRLAAREELTAVLVAQPLFALHLALAVAASDLRSARPLVVALGGTPCPASAERALRAWLAPVSAAVHVVQLYGAAEVDASCFAGVDRLEGVVRYRPRPDVSARATGVGTTLSVGDAEDAVAGYVDDAVRPNGDGTWTVTPSPTRFGRRTLAELERWSEDDWRRRTGRLGPPAVHPRPIELRRGVAPSAPGEHTSSAWHRTFGADWLDKPDWSDADEISGCE